MPYARINMAEFTSSAEAERTIAILRNDIKSVFPEIRAFACVETTETSTLTISMMRNQSLAKSHGAPLTSGHLPQVFVITKRQST